MIILKNFPKQPGKVKFGKYKDLLKELSSLPNVSKDFQKVVNHPALIQGDNLPEYWSRVVADGTHYLFLAQLPSKDLKYPIYSGQSLMEQSDFKELTINVLGKTMTQEFEFKPYQSLMLKISPAGKIEMVDISFVPKTPIVRAKEKQRMNF